VYTSLRRPRVPRYLCESSHGEAIKWSGSISASNIKTNNDTEY
jgi:hypothetical protein